MNSTWSGSDKEQELGLDSENSFSLQSLNSQLLMFNVAGSGEHDV